MIVRTESSNSAVARSHAAIQPGTARMCLLFFTLYLLTWVLLPLVLHRVPPGDNIEQLSWAGTPALGYPKHPPLPTWVLWCFDLVFAAGVPLTYALGGLEVAVVLLIAWRLAKESLDIRRAYVAPLLITCITYHTNRMHFYNHNTALLVACAASLYCAWRCFQSPGMSWWVALGLTWALGMLSKYQMAVPIVCNLLFLVTAYRSSTRQWIARVAVAGAVCLIASSPHLYWLYANHFPTFHYASQSLAAHLSIAQRRIRILHFGTDQLVRLLPLLLLLAALSRSLRRSQSASHPPARAERVAAKRMFALHSWGSLALMALLSLLAGVDLQTHWGTAFLWIVPLWILSTGLGERLARLRIRQVLTGVAAMQILMVLAYIAQW